MSVSFNGYREKVLTFKTASKITAGYPVKMSANDTVAAAASGNRFCGICLESDSSYATVQTGGTATLAYSGNTAPAVGYGTLAADGNGKVVVDSDGGEYLILSVDTTAKTVTFII